jgi:hypothetical protein
MLRAVKSLYKIFIKKSYNSLFKILCSGILILYLKILVPFLSRTLTIYTQILSETRLSKKAKPNSLMEH